jgi:phenylalanine-4-hydroxylase
VIDSFEQLFQATVAPDSGPINYGLTGAPSIPAGAVLDADAVIQRGAGEGWLTDGDV